MDTTEAYIKMCDCPEIQEKTKDDRCSFWANKLITGKYTVMCGYKLDIWLPRQDQIQEMMPQCNCSICLIEGLYKFTTDNIEGFFKFNFESMEQLWLAFYMHEKHKKIWDGKKWK